MRCLAVVTCLLCLTCRPARSDYAFSTSRVADPQGGTDFTWTVVVSNDEPFASLTFGGKAGAAIFVDDPVKPPGWEFLGDVASGIYNWEKTTPTIPPNDTNGTFNFTLRLAAVTALAPAPAITVDFFNDDDPNSKGTMTFMPDPPPAKPPVISKWLYAPVPEPSSLVLTGVGGIVLWGCLAARRRAA